jgi:hypothetical protein
VWSTLGNWYNDTGSSRALARQKKTLIFPIFPQPWTKYRLMRNVMDLHPCGYQKATAQKVWILVLLMNSPGFFLSSRRFRSVAVKSFRFQPPTTPPPGGVWWAPGNEINHATALDLPRASDCRLFSGTQVWGQVVWEWWVLQRLCQTLWSPLKQFTFRLLTYLWLSAVTFDYIYRVFVGQEFLMQKW